jgi:LysR family transcriptional regulator, cell division regulator
LKVKELDMDAADLRVFEVVARLGVMNKAAAELKTVPSNITTRIRQLEEEVGVPLFRRHTKGVALTSAGERLLPYAMKIARLLGEAKRAVEDDGNPKGQLRIGSLESTAAFRLPPIISRFGSAFPAVDMSLKTGTNIRLIEDVLSYDLDGAFVCGPLDHPELNQLVVFYEELMIATAFGRKRFASMTERGQLKIPVKGEGCAYRERFEDMLSRRGVNISQIEFGTLDAIVGCVAAGLGETLLPKTSLAPAIKAKRISAHSLPAADAKVETLFIKRNDAFVSRAMTAFMNMALKQSETMRAAE